MDKYTNAHLLQIAYDFLACYCEPKDLDVTINNILTNYRIDRDLFMEENGETLDLFHRMLKASQSRLSDIDEAIRYYFAAPDSDNKFESLSGLLTLHAGLYTPIEGTLDEHLNYLRTVPDDEYLKKLHRILASYNNTVIKSEPDGTMFNSAADVVRYIINMDLPADIKFRMQDIYFHRAKHLDRLQEILGKVISFILEYENELDMLYDRFFAYWNSRTKDVSFYEFIRNDLSALPDFGENPLGYHFKPCLYPLGFSLDAPFDDKTGTYIGMSTLTLGVFYGRVLTPNTILVGSSPDINEKKCLEAIKLLSDPSRFEILKYISDKEAYASEIAGYLGLTTATVSHHMGTLYTAELVTIRKYNNKLYYKLNAESLDKYLTYFEHKII